MKKSAVHILPHVAAALPFNAWQRAWGGRIFLPFYHLVADEAPPHVRHLYPVRTIRQFRADLDFFLKHFEVVDLPAFFAYVTEEKPVKRPVFHLTFDDGLRECHDVIMPALLEKGIPATFFLNPDFVDNRDLMFRYKASLLKESGRLFPQDPLMVSYADRRRLDEWAIETGFSFSDWQARQQPYLTTTQIKTMQLHGFTFGAHSLDHPFYARITPEEQQRQTLESLAW
ncbi:MAG: polysaccharide deacetylase family protein, partial [Saprospiraceae bacterium]|nr:polysaccharide deacetylase family protein [Saprospiraceae bacterium]